MLHCNLTNLYAEERTKSLADGSGNGDFESALRYESFFNP